MADEPGYRLRIDSEVRGNKLSVVPYIRAPAGSELHYEMVSRKQGPAGISKTSQSGRAAVGETGSAKLSTLVLGVTPQDRYIVTVKVFDGSKLVAEQAVHYPQ